jgi:copper(I)-binding protein
MGGSRFCRAAGRGVSIAICCVLLAGMGAARADAGGLSLSGAWMRIIIPSRPAAGYFTLTNSNATPRTLVGAASPACGGLMLHQSLQQGGQDSMVMVPRVVVPAHGTLRFAPGGYHLMCTAPGPAVRPGGQVMVTLRFADGATVSGAFPVRGVGRQ